MILEDEMIHGRPASAPSTRQHSEPRRPLRIRRPSGTPGGQAHPASRPRAAAHPERAAALPFPGGWDASIQLYHKLQNSQQAGRASSGRRARIEHDTPIVPRALAACVCEEASQWLREPFPQAWVIELAERAEVVYHHNARFRQLLRKPGNAGRDWLAAFMRHWLSALLSSRRPDLHQRLPSSYASGRELPPAIPSSTN